MDPGFCAARSPRVTACALSVVLGPSAARNPGPIVRKWFVRHLTGPGYHTQMKTLDEWLAWQQRVHPREIELGLDRVRAVWQRLGARQPASCVITVGGTNGKGSTVALLEAMLRAAGHSSGCYTSPHLLRYNERIRIRGTDAADDALITAFERIEAARDETPLTWFEYGTLAALELMADAEPDVALLEVGLGGRLDAVNLVDADAAIVTSVGIDHVEYLGPDRDSIGHEKAGIFRAGRPAIVGDPDPPDGLLEAARAIGADLLVADRDFRLRTRGGRIEWVLEAADADHTAISVPLQQADIDAPARARNLAAALAALYALRDQLAWRPDLYADAAARVHPPARVQHIGAQPDIVVDVAHNPHAAAALAEWLHTHPVKGVTHAVFGAMADKDVAGISTVLEPIVQHWYCCPLPEAGQRGLDADAVQRRLAAGHPGARCSQHASVAAALDAACAAARPQDRVLAFGSFHLAGAALRWQAVRSEVTER